MPRAISLAILLGACSNDPGFEACGDAPILRVPAIGCETHTIVAGDDGQCPSDFPPPDDARGSWVRLSRREGVPAFVRITADGAPGCDPATGRLCPFASTVDLEGLPCDCPLAGAHLRQVWWFEGGARTFTLYRPEHQLVLGPTGHTFEVEVCRTRIDGYPLCQEAAGDGSGCPPGTRRGGPYSTCICQPECRTTAACVVPTTGDAAVECSPAGVCILDCTDGQTCPDGQVCRPSGEDGSRCSWPEWPS